MIQLLVIADDFTGALDTGVQFAASGVRTRVSMNIHGIGQFSGEEADVLVVDAETRHLSPEAAYAVTEEIVRDAVRAGITHLYKKTDSALRGNIGSELAAMLSASGGKRIHFAPAFPRHGRTTVDGVHYIGGIPVAEGVFGRDPFEPVTSSNVAEIISAQTDVPVTNLAYPPQAEKLGSGIYVYDAQTDDQLEAIANALGDAGELTLLAGCAGFAAVLTALFGMKGEAPALPVFSEGFFIACGSVNPITCAQLDCAEQSGFLRLRLTPEQKLNGTWAQSAEGCEAVRKWSTQLLVHQNCILDVNDAEPGATDALAARQGVDSETLRRQISQTMGELVKGLLDGGLCKNLMITGGDTLLGFLSCIGTETLEPVCELSPGAVLSRLQYGGRTYHLISKSGGFGGRTLLPELAAMMNNERNGGEAAL